MKCDRRNMGTGRRLWAVAIFFAVICSAFVAYCAANASGPLLTVESRSVYVGDTFFINGYFSGIELQSVGYQISEESGDEGCISVSPEGQVTALSAGSAEVTVSYLEKGAAQASEETFYVDVYEPEELEAAYGDQVSLKAFSVYAPDAYEYVFSGDGLRLADDKGSVLVQGFQSGTVYVKSGEISVAVAQITVNLPALESEEGIARATGTEPYVPKLNNYTPIAGDADVVWTAENEKVAVATGGAVTAVAVGSTKIHATVTAANQEKLELTFPFSVTDPKLTKSRVVLAAGIRLALPVTGTCSASTYGQKDGDKSYASISGTKLVGNAKGSMTLHLIVDGRNLPLKVVVTNPHYNQISIAMYKGMSTKFSLSGLNKQYSKVSFSSGNKKVATISKAGKIKAKKIGNAKVTAKADGKKITIWVQIGAKRAYQASRKEIQISGRKTRYSQARRMQKGYYDCSSLVTRVYRQYKVYFGRRSGWAPTAADIGKWCTTHKKVVAKKGIPYYKLVPGDLLCYSYNGNNGRYRNIDHIDMYIGNGMCVSASSSRNKVAKVGYYPGSVVLVARPVKG